MNQISALNNPKRVDMPLNKPNIVAKADKYTGLRKLLKY